MEVMYKFSPSEIIQQMDVVGETYKLGSRPTETGRGKRLFAQMIPEEYRSEAKKVIDMCKRAYGNGLKNDVEMTSKQAVVLKMLVDYVMVL